MNSEVTEFGYILLFVVGAIVFLAAVLFTGKLLRPSRPNEEKNATYESGEEAVGNAWAMFNPRFYIIAIIFLLFEVELLFLFPWSTVFGNKIMIETTSGYWGRLAVVEMMIFVGILALGLAYVWKKGYLNWEQPVHIKYNNPNFKAEKYTHINQKYARKPKL